MKKDSFKRRMIIEKRMQILKGLYTMAFITDDYLLYNNVDDAIKEFDVNIYYDRELYDFCSNKKRFNKLYNKITKMFFDKYGIIFEDNTFVK